MPVTPLTQGSTNIDAEVTSFFKYKDLGTFLHNVVTIIISIGTALALLYLFWGALDFIMSGGNQERNQTAKNKITNAIIGLAILAFIWIIWKVATYFLGLSPSLKGGFTTTIKGPGP